MTDVPTSNDRIIREQRALLDEAEHFLVGIESDPRSFGYARSGRASQWLRCWQTVREKADRMPAVETAERLDLGIGAETYPTGDVEHLEARACRMRSRTDRSKETIVCPSCGKDEVDTFTADDSFQYGIGDNPVTLVARNVLFFRCVACRLEYTGEDSETKREQAVKDYLSKNAAPSSKDELDALPAELDEALRYAMREKAAATRPQHHAFGHMSDEWVADRVSLLSRNDLFHEMIVRAARDRIMRLSLAIAECEKVIIQLGQSLGQAARAAPETIGINSTPVAQMTELMRLSQQPIETTERCPMYWNVNAARCLRPKGHGDECWFAAPSSALPTDKAFGAMPPVEPTVRKAT
jgi:hypothetical protein